jgi:hypothetical protein
MKNYTYWNGALAEYTGKTITFAGGFFYEIKLHEGANGALKGQFRHTPVAPAFLPCGSWVTKEEVMKYA